MFRTKKQLTLFSNNSLDGTPWNSSPEVFAQTTFGKNLRFVTKLTAVSLIVIDLAFF